MVQKSSSAKPYKNYSVRHIFIALWFPDFVTGVKQTLYFTGPVCTILPKATSIKYPLGPSYKAKPFKLVREFLHDPIKSIQEISNK